MKSAEINIRDPFVFPYEGKYYMTGTRGATVWAKHATGFDGYVSDDLEHWEGPYPLFERNADFAEDKLYWAPEIHRYGDSFYIFATLARSDGSGTKGTWAFRADTPLGPYHVHSSGKLTPEQWQCLDGTLYVSRSGQPYMVFCHEWADTIDGEICAAALSGDLTHTIGEVRTLFTASQGQPTVQGLRHPAKLFRKVYVTDGPFLFRDSVGALRMLWSSYGKGGYLQLLARSDNGELDGNWSIDREPLFKNDGGHGMIFRTFDGQMKLVLHTPNKYRKEHPAFIDLEMDSGGIRAVL